MQSRNGLLQKGSSRQRYWHAILPELMFADVDKFEVTYSLFFLYVKILHSV